jgi:macrolide-specific efflux system membrane fusion protein
MQHIHKFFFSLFILVLFVTPSHAQNSYGTGGYGGLSGLTGRAVSWRSGKVSTQIPGLVKSVQVKIGDIVRRGDVLAIMDHVLLESDMLQAQSELAETSARTQVAKARMRLKKNILGRQKKLRRSSAFQQSRLDEAKLNFNIVEAEYKAAKARERIQHSTLQRKQLNIKLSTIRAPYDGVIQKMFTQVGAFITPETPNVLEMIDTSAIEIEVDIAVQDTKNYKKGAEVTFKNSNGDSFRAVVRALLPVINIRTQTRAVRFTPQDKTVIVNLVIGQEVTLIQPKNSE